MVDDCQVYISVIARKAKRIQRMNKAEILAAMDQFGDSKWPSDLKDLSGYTKTGVWKWIKLPAHRSEHLEKYSKQLLIRYLERAA